MEVTTSTLQGRSDQVVKYGSMTEAVIRMVEYSDKAFSFYNEDGEFTPYSFQELSRMAQDMAAAMHKRGITKGDGIAIVSEDNFQVITILFACFVVGAIPVVLHVPKHSKGQADFQERMTHMLATAEVKHIVHEADYVEILEDCCGQYITDKEELLIEYEELRTEQADNSLTTLFLDRVTSSEDVALYQFTSGSTDSPRCVALTHKSLLTNAVAISNGMKYFDHDKGMCWLPLYHDMGLFGHVIMTMCQGLSCMFAPTVAFIKRPSRWMKWISDYRCTISYAPNFAFSLCANPRYASTLDLSSLRVLGCGSEPISADILRTFYENHKEHGLNANAIMPCFGMAEHTLAASFSSLEAPIYAESISLDTYESQLKAVPAKEHEKVKEVISCGTSFPGHDIVILDPTTEEEVPERTVGEIVLKGDSLAAGYKNNPEETALRFMEKGYKSGDLGYLANGELFVTGRIKDLIILFGRNYDPQQFEQVVEELPQIRSGCCYAFSVEHATSEKLIIVFETKDKLASELQTQVKRLIWENFAVAAHDVVPVKLHSLPKTSSGKKQRKLTKEFYLQDQLDNIN